VTESRLNADQRRALELLADAAPHGCTGAMLLAHGFNIETLAELVHGGFAAAHRQPLKAGKRQIEVACIKVTAAGRRALEAGGC
jgi:hypothetical protein